MRLNDGCCAEHAVEMLLRQRKVVNGGEWATGKGVSWLIRLYISTGKGI